MTFGLLHVNIIHEITLLTAFFRNYLELKQLSRIHFHLALDVMIDDRLFICHNIWLFFLINRNENINDFSRICSKEHVFFPQQELMIRSTELPPGSIDPFLSGLTDHGRQESADSGLGMGNSYSLPQTPQDILDESMDGVSGKIYAAVSLL